MAVNTRLVYLSQATVPFNDEQLTLLASKSAARNALCNVTGMLLYSSGHFLQCLEGDALTLKRILERISNDKRHRDVKTLVNEQVDARIFPNWCMGVLNLDRKGSELDRARFEERVVNARRTVNGQSSTDVVKLFREFKSQLPAPAVDAALTR